MMRDEPFHAFESAEDGCLLAQAIVDTVREPLLVLDRNLRIIAASRSFYLTFEMTRQVTQGRKIYDLIKSLAQQLEAQVEVASGPKGTTVSVTYATFISRLPTAA